jgi:uncharacterized phage-associated protein
MAGRPMPIKFTANKNKIIEALAWLANQREGITFYYIGKILYFADKAHLQQYGRPILGDSYFAPDYGPVPSLAYDMLKFNDFLDPETLNNLALAIRVEREEDGKPHVYARRNADTNYFSATDLKCLHESFEKHIGMTVKQLYDLSHQEPAYIAAPPNGTMDYELIIDEDVPNRSEIIERLHETAPYIVV